MGRKQLQQFSVDYLQVMQPDGTVTKKHMPKLSKDVITNMYEDMVLARTFDEKALKLQRQGRIGTYASGLGQEACQIGSIYAMHQSDWIFPAFRENAALISRGVPMETLYALWGGDERGNAVQKEIHTFTAAIPVGTHMLHAVGFAMATQMKGEDYAVATYFGDGATSEGDFHEALNWAGVFQAPTVFLCQNNQYAISVPVEQQTSAETLAQKAIAYGFNGIQVDGNDVFAVYMATKQAVKNARQGEGPTFIELHTYRRENHTTADDWQRYRSEEEVEEWKEKDPVERLQAYLKQRKLWSKEYQQDLEERCTEAVESAVKQYEQMGAPPISQIFDHHFATVPPELKAQKQWLQGYVEE